MFIRVKRIKGRRYAYSVKNTWTDKGPRQKVNDYLGKVIKFELTNNPVSFNIDLENIQKGEIFKELAKHELIKLGFKENDAFLENGNIFFDLNNLALFEKKRKQKEIVLELNEGFLCNATIKELMSYRPEEDNEGAKLANLLVSAGIKVEEEIFVKTFEKLRGMKEQLPEPQEKIDFYY